MSALEETRPLNAKLEPGEGTQFTLVAEKHPKADDYQWQLDGGQGSITMVYPTLKPRTRVRDAVACRWKARYRWRSHEYGNGLWSAWLEFDNGIDCLGYGDYWSPYILPRDRRIRVPLSVLSAEREPGTLIFFETEKADQDGDAA